MVRRPVFVPDSGKPYVSELSLDFEQFSGSSIQQKQRSTASLHASYVARFPSSRVLEVSSKSERDLGVQLSAFNLMIEHPERGSYSVECAFQASKVFEHGGPFVDLFDVSSRAAKTDRRLRESGKRSSPVEWCNRFVSFGLGYALSWSGVSSCWVGCGVSRDLVRMSRLR